MPIVSPQLDDLTYDRVVAELTRRIPVYSPEWTDFNDSDPGITLIQLFAYLAEMVGYRLNRIPEKNEIELLKLLGIELNPAHAATTRLALLLQDPTTVVSSTVLAGASGKATAGAPPPAFQTTADIDITPAECVALLTTLNPDLRDLLKLADGSETAYSPGTPAANWLTTAWDGKTPNLKDMPLAPVDLGAADNQPYIWVGVNYNTAIDAGFLGVQVVLTIQFDDDEQPTFTITEECGPQSPQAEVGKAIDWLWYFDAQETNTANSLKQVKGRIDDSTRQFSQSGTITFTVPTTLGPMPAGDFQNLSGPQPNAPTPVEICLTLAKNLGAGVGAIPAPGTSNDCNGVATWINAYSMALRNAVTSTQNSPPSNPTPVVPHPLSASLQTTIGWFRIDLPLAPTVPLDFGKVRMITFNVVPAVNATTVNNELLGVADGTPGQTYQLANQNVQPGTLVVNVQESSAADPQPLVPWTVVDSLDAAGPNDSVAALDPEAGTVTFGDGVNGRIPPLVPGGGNIVALQYAWAAGKPETSPSPRSPH